MSYVGLGARLRTPLRSISIGLIGWLLVCGPGWAQEDGSTGEAPEVAGAAEAGPLQGEAAQPQPSFQPFNRLLPPMTEAPCIEEPPEPVADQRMLPLRFDHQFRVSADDPVRRGDVQRQKNLFHHDRKR